MIGAVIRWSIANRFIVALFAIVLGASGIWALRTTPVDAIPDLSEVQVIVRTPYAGQAPQVIEDQPSESGLLRATSSLFYIQSGSINDPSKSHGLTLIHRVSDTPPNPSQIVCPAITTIWRS